MEQLLVESRPSNNFISANTLDVNFHDLKENHIIPVFAKDNHPLISQFQVIESMQDVLKDFQDLQIDEPLIKVSHPIKGRVPEARFKPVEELLPDESTLYYERMMFLIEVHNCQTIIDGKKLKLVLGGVKSYSWDNLGKDKRSNQHFKFFIGFQVQICSNLKVWSDGVVLNFKTTELNQLGPQIKLMIESFNPEKQSIWMKKLLNYSLSESQFAHFLGKCRLYPHLDERVGVYEMNLTDSQLNSIAKAYLQDPVFGKKSELINFWDLYNLMTDSIKSSYIDGYLDRAENCYGLINNLMSSIDQGKENWFLI